jgi:hypothetical protein
MAQAIQWFLPMGQEATTFHGGSRYHFFLSTILALRSIIVVLGYLRIQLNLLAEEHLQMI